MRQRVETLILFVGLVLLTVEIVLPTPWEGLMALALGGVFWVLVSRADRKQPRFAPRWEIGTSGLRQYGGDDWLILNWDWPKWEGDGR